jgi:hypothetical protein
MPHLHAGRCQQRHPGRKHCQNYRGRASHLTCPHHLRPPCSAASRLLPGHRRRARAQPAATWTLTHAVQHSAPARRLQLLRRRRRVRAQPVTTGVLPHTLRQGAQARRPRRLRRGRAAPHEWRPGWPARVQPRPKLQLRARLLGVQRCCARWAPARLHRPGAPAACAYTLPLPGGRPCRTCHGLGAHRSGSPHERACALSLPCSRALCSS